MISDLQRRIIQLYASGLSGVQIRRMLGISEVWLRQQVKAAKEALGAKTLPHLIAIFLMHPELVPSQEVRSLKVVVPGQPEASRKRIETLRLVAMGLDYGEIAAKKRAKTTADSIRQIVNHIARRNNCRNVRQLCYELGRRGMDWGVNIGEGFAA